MSKKFKKGAASFYIVAFSTLILLIIATSFAAIIISEITRTTNNELAQSAYDSALAGIEDAKLAFYNYQNCLKNTGLENCKEIIKQIDNPNCDMVGRILGRVGPEGGEVMIQESKIGNNTQQAYTCVKIETSLEDYRGTISAANPMKAVRVKFDEYVDENNVTHQVHTSDINSVEISWFSDANVSKFNFTNFNRNQVIFPSSVNIGTAIPPTISLAMIQTSKVFNLESFEKTQGNQTNRGMVYLVPSTILSNSFEDATDDGGEVASKNRNGSDVNYNYIGTWNGTKNYINNTTKLGFLKSNDKTTNNLPYAVYCPINSGNEFACSTTIELPQPIGGDRSEDTFTFVVALPYGKPNTDFSLKFYCETGKVCTHTEEVVDNDGTVIAESITTNQAMIKGAQIKIDSNGRANDLYRRVEARLENSGDGANLSILGPLELLGENDSSNPLLRKTWPVVCEWNFPNRGC